MALRGKLIRAPTGSRAHFLRESQAKAVKARPSERSRGFGNKFAPLITRERMLQERAHQAEARKKTFEQASKTRQTLGKFVSWARERLAPREREVEFGGVRLSREESGALRNLVNRKKLSRHEEMMVGEALEKMVRREGKGSAKRQAA